VRTPRQAGEGALYRGGSKVFFPLDDLHCLRVPVDGLLLEVAHVREQRGGRGAEAEYRVLDYWLAVAHGVEEDLEVVERVAVARGRSVDLGILRPYHRLLLGVALTVLADHCLLDLA